MLETPLGNIELLIDGKPVEYNAVPVGLDKLCLNLMGRFRITISFRPDGKKHEILCRIKDYISTRYDGIESGERLELKSFYKDCYKLSISAEGDSGYYPNGTRVSDYYDYDNEYYNDGVSYLILESTSTSNYRFGIAWIKNYNDANEVQTWYGADTTLM
ncbi:MAG: hypothetical protein PHQ72_09590 [Hespellia sp.]|nr:hypothetical protein [Hespellia sp.]